MFSDMAKRIQNAHHAFEDTLMELAGLDRLEAKRALNTFLKAKAVRLDPVGGRMIVKHGAFMELDVIRRAANH